MTISESTTYLMESYLNNESIFFPTLGAAVWH